VYSANSASNDAAVRAPAAPLASPTPPMMLASTRKAGWVVNAKIA
jgi:hypothetical protein